MMEWIIFSIWDRGSTGLISETVRNSGEQGWTGLLMCGWKLRSESKIRPKFLAVGLMWAGRVQRVFSVSKVECVGGKHKKFLIHGEGFGPSSMLYLVI